MIAAPSPHPQRAESPHRTHTSTQPRTHIVIEPLNQCCLLPVPLMLTRHISVSHQQSAILCHNAPSLVSLFDALTASNSRLSIRNTRGGVALLVDVSTISASASAATMLGSSSESTSMSTTSSTRQTSLSSYGFESKSSSRTSSVSGDRTVPAVCSASEHRLADASSRKQTMESDPFSTIEKYWASAVPASCTSTQIGSSAGSIKSDACTSA
mmetsp:Transcript_5041/g.10837  ORF Transcript_5041/g.10837 Transcript_5041/m.10837 type:complete len:212 (-) Transcript_5041:89-724(-)